MALSNDQKKFYENTLSVTKREIQELEGEIQEELAKIREKSVTKQELERAKKYLVGTHEISLQRRAALASTLAFHQCYGQGWDEYKRYAPSILAVTAADVLVMANLYGDIVSDLCAGLVGGLGLVGMRERVASVGGDLAAGLDRSTFRVSAVLPALAVRDPADAPREQP